MKYIPPKFEKLRDMAAIDVGRLTGDEARVILEGYMLVLALGGLFPKKAESKDSAAKISS